MRESIRAFTEICVGTLPLDGPVYEFGSLQVQGNPEMADLRELFHNKTFVGCDMRKGAGVDLVLDLHSIDLPDATAATVISLDTLEHVEYPRTAVDEIYRILKPGGVVILTSVMRFPIHGYPDDFWRFTPHGFKSLLKPFKNSFVGSCGGTKDFPQTIVGVGFKGAAPELGEFNAKFIKWAHFNNKVDEKVLPLENLEFEPSLL